MNTHVLVWASNTKSTDLPEPKIIDFSQGVRACHINENWLLAVLENGSTYYLELTSNLPKQVDLTVSVKQVAVNSTISLLISEQGEGWIWGEDPFEAGIVTSKTPSKLKDLKDLVQGSLGDTHAAVIDSKGNLYTWGSGSVGQLGTPAFEVERQTPQLVESAKIFTAKQVLCGKLFTCVCTKGGYVYFYGNIGAQHSGIGSRFSPIMRKRVLAGSPTASSVRRDTNYPYSHPELEHQFVTSIVVGDNFLGALNEEGQVFVFDECMDLVKLPVCNDAKIREIGATSSVIYGLSQDSRVVYEWKEPCQDHLSVSYDFSCQLSNWEGKMYVLAEDYLPYKLVTNASSMGCMVCRATGETPQPLAKHIATANPYSRSEYARRLCNSLYDSIEVQLSPPSQNSSPVKEGFDDLERLYSTGNNEKTIEKIIKCRIEYGHREKLLKAFRPLTNSLIRLFLKKLEKWSSVSKLQNKQTQAGLRFFLAIQRNFVKAGWVALISHNRKQIAKEGAVKRLGSFLVQTLRKSLSKKFESWKRRILESNIKSMENKYFKAAIKIMSIRLSCAVNRVHKKAFGKVKSASFAYLEEIKPATKYLVKLLESIEKKKWLNALKANSIQYSKVLSSVSGFLRTFQNFELKLLKHSFDQLKQTAFKEEYQKLLFSSLKNQLLKPKSTQLRYMPDTTIQKYQKLCNLFEILHKKTELRLHYFFNLLECNFWHQKLSVLAKVLTPSLQKSFDCLKLNCKLVAPLSSLYKSRLSSYFKLIITSSFAASLKKVCRRANLSLCKQVWEVLGWTLSPIASGSYTRDESLVIIQSPDSGKISPRNFFPDICKHLTEEDLVKLEYITPSHSMSYLPDILDEKRSTPAELDDTVKLDVFNSGSLGVNQIKTRQNSGVQTVDTSDNCENPSLEYRKKLIKKYSEHSSTPSLIINKKPKRKPKKKSTERPPWKPNNKCISSFDPKKQCLSTAHLRETYDYNLKARKKLINLKKKGSLDNQTPELLNIVQKGSRTSVSSSFESRSTPVQRILVKKKQPKIHTQLAYTKLQTALRKLKRNLLLSGFASWKENSQIPFSFALQTFNLFSNHKR